MTNCSVDLLLVHIPWLLLIIFPYMFISYKVIIFKGNFIMCITVHVMWVELGGKKYDSRSGIIFSEAAVILSLILIGLWPIYNLGCITIWPVLTCIIKSCLRCIAHSAILLPVQTCNTEFFPSWKIPYNADLLKFSEQGQLYHLQECIPESQLHS